MAVTNYLLKISDLGLLVYLDLPGDLDLLRYFWLLGLGLKGDVGDMGGLGSTVEGLLSWERICRPLASSN